MIGTTEAAERMQESQKVVRDRIKRYGIPVTYLNQKTMTMTDKAFKQLVRKYLAEKRDELLVLDAHVQNLEALL
jgi:hypothetical protein